MNRHQNVNFFGQTGRHLINQAEFAFKWQNATGKTMKFASGTATAAIWMFYGGPLTGTGETLLAEIFFILYTEISFKTLESFLKLGISVKPLFKDLCTQRRGKSFSPALRATRVLQNGSFQVFGNQLIAMAGW
jgi:hypothetical protein